MGKSVAELRAERKGGSAPARGPRKEREGPRRRVGSRHTSQSPADPTDPNGFMSVLRGAVGEGAKIADAVSQFAYDMSLAPGAREGGGVQEVDLIEDPYTLGADVTGVPAAKGSTGQSFERAGEFMTDAALTAPLAAAAAPAIGVSPVLAVLAELGFAGAGGFASGELEAEGHAGLGLGAAAVMGAPVTAGSRTAQKVATRADDIYSSITKMTRPALSYVDELGGVSRRSLVRGSEELKANVPDVPAFIEELKRAEGINADHPGAITSRQAADNLPNARGGPHWSAMEERISRDSKEYGTKRALARANFLDYLAREWETIGGDEAGDYIEFLARYDDGAGILKTQERAAWRVVRDGEQPVFDMSSTQRYVSNQMSGLKLEDDLAAVPSVFKDILDVEKFSGDNGKLSTKFSLNDFQDVRSNLLEIVRESKMNSTKQNRRAASMAIPVLKRMQRQINKWDKADDTGRSLEYLTAKRVTRENKTLYDHDSPIIRTLDSGGADKNLFTSLRNARGKKGKRFNSETEAKRLHRIASQTPDGVRNLRKLAVDDLFRNSQGLNPTATRTPLKTLLEHDKAYKIVLGDDYDNAVQLLEWSQLATRGSAGTPNQAMRTGSGIAPAQFLFGLMSEAVSPTPGVGVASAVVRMMKDSVDPKDVLQMLRIEVKAMEDPKFMRILMEMPTEAALPAWRVKWKQLLQATARDTTRAGARAGLNRTQAGAFE